MARRTEAEGGWKNFSSIFDSFQEDDGWRPSREAASCC